MFPRVPAGVAILEVGAPTRSHLGQPDCSSVAAEAVRLLQHHQIHAEGGRLLQEGQVRPVLQRRRLLQGNSSRRQES